MKIEGRVRGALIKMAGVDGRDPGVAGQSANVTNGVCPGLAAIAGNLQIAVVSSRPDHTGVLWGLSDRINRGMHFRGGIVHGDPARLFLLLLFRIVGGEIRRDALPRLSMIARAKQKLRAQIDSSVLCRTNMNRGIPVEAKLAFLVLRQGLDAAGFLRLSIDAADVTALRLSIDVIRV